MVHAPGLGNAISCSGAFGTTPARAAAHRNFVLQALPDSTTAFDKMPEKCAIRAASEHTHPDTIPAPIGRGADHFSTEIAPTAPHFGDIP